MKVLHMVAFILLIIGGLNLGLSALGYDVIGMLLGASSITQILYIIIGLSAVFEVVTHKSSCKMCTSGQGM